MKIWIISSWSETLSLFSFLTKYTHEYIVYYDFFHRPYGEKTFEQSLVCVETGVAYLLAQGVDCIIVPPVYELYIMQNSESKIQKKNILPIFSTYVSEYCFKYSLIGKLGLIWDFADLQVAQHLVADYAKTYIRSSLQERTKKFHFPFSFWTKDTSLRKYYLNWLSYSHILVNKIIKFDLRYFKDAAVDTVIPLNYGYFHYQTTITKFLNFKHIRFHSLTDLETIFLWLIQNHWDASSYKITVAYTWHPEFLKKDKRLLRLLQRGKTTQIDWIGID